MFHRRSAVALSVALLALTRPAAALSPILQFDFTGGSTANTGTGSQTAAPIEPGQVVASGGLDGSGSYENHSTPVDGVNYEYQYGRFGGGGLDNNLRSLTVTMWLKADVPFANGPNSNIPLFSTAGFNFSSREQSAGPTQQFGVSTGNSTQPVILLDKAANATPAFGTGDVGNWRFIALTLGMVYDGVNTNTTVTLYRGSLTDPVSLWGGGFRTQDGDRTTELDNAFAIGNDRLGDYFKTQRQFLGEIDDVRFYGSGSAGVAALSQGALEEIRAEAVPEPETAPLFALGLAALTRPRRRAAVHASS